MNKLKEFLEGTMSESDKDQVFEQLIAAKRDRDKKIAWQQKLKGKYGVERNSKYISKKKVGRVILSLAACFSLIILAYYFIADRNREKHMIVVNEHIANLDIMTNQNLLRKGHQDVEEIRAEANLSYSKAEYEKSILLWETLTTAELANGIDYFYLALCYLQKEQAEPQRSIDLLEKSKSLKGPKEEISWVLSLAYLKAGQKDNAIQELNKILANDAYKTAEARELLNLLKE